MDHDVVSSEVKRALPSELMPSTYAQTMEQLGRRVAEWKASLLDKGLKVIVGSKMITLESGHVMSVGNESRQILFNVQYVKIGFTRGAVVCVVTYCG